MTSRWTNRLVAALAVLVPFVVYLRTMARTVPFWDAGEFIAVSKILGVPHPPGTPLFVLTGHVFGLLPLFRDYATRINFVSVVTGMITIAFTYLLVQKAVLHLAMDEPDERTRLSLSYVAGLTAAWFTAFSHSFWNTSTEIAHVHVGASAIMFFALWTSVNWWERRGEDRNERRLMSIWYMMCAGIGWHLGGFLVLPAVVLFALVVDWRRSWWMALGVAIIVAWLKFTGWMDSWDMQHPNTGVWYSLAFLVGLCVVVHFVLPRDLRPFLWITVGAFAVGLSVHVYLVIRAGQNPMINEAAPSTWSALWDEFTRKQYAPPSPLQRGGTWTYQLDYMFWRYFRDEFTMGPAFQSAPGVKPFTGMLYFLAAGVPVILGEVGRLFQLLKGQLKAEAWALVHLGVWALAIVMYAFLGLHAGAIFVVFLMHVVDLFLGITWKQQLYVLIEACFLVGSLGLILYLNFKDPQVRERDYFFLWGYETYTVWIGLGVLAVIHEGLRALRAGAAKRVLVPALGALALLMPVATCAHFYFEQDRTGNFVARDYAYNMLQPLAPNSIIFTNGDNDTFPLWYLQEVEGIRKDVRLVNLSLLNTNWYIKQLRDLEPRVPIRYGDAEVDALEPYRAADGSIVLVKDIMVKHIVEANHDSKPIYLAVTVPEQMGMERRLSLEGLSYRILSDSTHPFVNMEKTRECVYQIYKYRGLLDSTGAFTPVPYKDENSTRLAGNYSAAHVRLAFAYNEAGQLARAMEELTRAEKISPDFSGVAVARGVFYAENRDTTRAIEAYKDGVRRFPTSPELNYRLGVLYAMRGRYADAVPLLDVARRSDPDNGSVVLSLFTLLAQMGQGEQADQVIRPYLEAHPDDARARGIYNQVMRHMGRPGVISPEMPQQGGIPSTLPGD